MNQTTTSSCTRKYAQQPQQKSATQRAQQAQQKRATTPAQITISLW